VNQAEYDRVAGELMQLARSIEDGKRPGYTIGSEDVLANFKRVAERVGVTTEQAWAIYFLKHIDAICSVMTAPNLPVSEAPPGRFADAVNYLRLGYAIWRERSDAAALSLPSPPPTSDRLLPDGTREPSWSELRSRLCGTETPGPRPSPTSPVLGSPTPWGPV
jgi:hypothetical protein